MAIEASNGYRYILQLLRYLPTILSIDNNILSMGTEDYNRSGQNKIIYLN